MKSTVYYMVGVPASGKSTFAEKLREEKSIPILSSDELRKELTGDAADQDTVPRIEIFRQLQIRAKQMLDQGRSFIWDATGIDATHRHEDINSFKRLGARVEGFLFVTPEEIAQQRNLKRKRVVPPEILERYHYTLVNDPVDTKFDLFDTVSIVDENGEVMQVYDREVAKEHNIEVEVSPKEFTPKPR